MSGPSDALMVDAVGALQAHWRSSFLQKPMAPTAALCRTLPRALAHCMSTSSSPTGMTDKSWWINTWLLCSPPGATLRPALQGSWRPPGGVGGVSPAAHSRCLLINTPCIGFLPVPLPSSLLPPACPRITSQINYSHSCLCPWACLWGNSA